MIQIARKEGEPSRSGLNCRERRKLQIELGRRAADFQPAVLARSTPEIAGQAYIEGRTDQSLRWDVTHMKYAASQANRPRACELETSVARLKKRMVGLHGRKRHPVRPDEHTSELQ